MPWDAGASMDRLQRTLQSLRDLKQRRREQGWNIVSDLLGKGLEVGKTWYDSKEADKRQLSAQEAAKELEYIRQGGDLARLTTEYGLRGGEAEKEYGLRAGEEAKKYENLFPLWDQIFPGLSREQQLAKWSYWQGMSRPSDSAKDPQAESQWTSAAAVQAKNAVLSRYADPNEFPSEANFWSAVAKDPALAQGVKNLYRTTADQFLRDYIKDSAARTVAVDSLVKDFEVYISSVTNYDQGGDGGGGVDSGEGRETIYSDALAKVKELAERGIDSVSQVELQRLTVADTYEKTGRLPPSVRNPDTVISAAKAVLEKVKKAYDALNPTGAKATSDTRGWIEVR